MSRAAEQVFVVTEHQLWKLVGHGTHSGAKAAWDRFLSIRSSSGKPVCFYSEAAGFTVADSNEQDPEKSRRIMLLEQRATPFPG